MGVYVCYTDTVYTLLVAKLLSLLLCGNYTCTKLKMHDPIHLTNVYKTLGGCNPLKTLKHSRIPIKCTYDT